MNPYSEQFEYVVATHETVNEEAPQQQQQPGEPSWYQVDVLFVTCCLLGDEEDP